ncbi:UNVERIFIED_CONTAM: Autophagy-related protein 2 [Sesamum latifolium]|uniref:Autophagy-related protein 2 n=1 Tax=Sesamum latifolium TaxID=2727402 RepID=A0AAW2V1D8_9LAMI
MFSWSIPKSAEAMFSRWAIKRVCKFLLKKKLGKLILGDIDLHQLDVQLGAGTIQLSDLALNVDYINEKFGTAVLVKEGSIGSLLVTMPWKDGGCGIEVDELEVVLAPRRVKASPDESETCRDSKNCSNSSSHGIKKLDNETLNSRMANSSVDVHEGVKTIAKMVKWLLTSFHVKIKKLIVAFDPLLEEGNKKGLDRILVLRISEVECGTHISEDASSNSFTTANNFLGLSRLTNFVKFQGAVLELLDADGLDHQSPHECYTETAVGNSLSGYCSSSNMVTIICGEKGGFSGNLKLILPWKDGSLDISKVDADLHIEPLEIRIQPSTIRYSVFMWDLFKGIGFTTDSCLTEKEPVNTLLSESHLISDWKLILLSHHLVAEQQHVETNFNARITKVSVLLSFIDGDQKSLQMKDAKGNTDLHIHRLCAQFVDLFCILQVRPREMNIELTMQHIQLVDHLCSKSDLADYKMHGCDDNSESGTLIQKMQEGVQGALLTFQDSNKFTRKDHQVDRFVGIPLSIQDNDGCCHMINGKNICGKDNSVTLLKTSGVSQCHVRVKSGSSGGSLTGPTSFSLKLPHFVCWVNFDLVSRTLEFLKEIEKCIEITHMEGGFGLESEIKRYVFSPLGDQGKISRRRSTNVSTKKDLEGNILLSNARIILCFPLKERNDFSCYSSCSQFIALEFISPTIVEKDIQSPKPIPAAKSEKSHAMTTSCSLKFNFGDFYLFFINSVFKEKIDGSETYNRQEASFSVEKIISAVNKTGHQSLVSLFWQESPVTGPWIAKKAKILASSENGRREDDKVVGRGCEFAAITTVKESNDFGGRTREEILASSAILLHGQLPPVTINLDKSQFENICGLLNQMVENFSCIISESVTTREKHSALQTSFLVECDSVTVSLVMDPVADVKSSIHSELPGSWLSLSLQVDKFELLSASNIGGISSSNFLWLAHGQGSLWGSTTEGLHREFLLISCIDSTMGRGDGEGSNMLSSRYAGSDIINLWDPESNHSFTSITVRGATIVAMGGRLDWFNAIFSFFILPSPQFDQVADAGLEKTCGSSFILNLVDVGLSYQPYLENLPANEGSGCKSSYININESKNELHVACLLSASSLKLSNTTVVDCTEGEYKIRLQDLGLLICTVSESKFLGRTYTVEHLRKNGYVKVAHEAHAEVLLRTNCENGHAWELECAESHIMLNTCHDTTFGLIRLAAQLQKLFAPDLQDYVVHLENRWNNVQQVHENSDKVTLGCDFSPALPPTETSCVDKKSKVGNLMDEICEDVFQLDGNSDGQAKIFESHSHAFTNDSPVVVSGASSSEEKTPEFIEEYFLSDLRPLSELALKSQSSDILVCKTDVAGEARTGHSGWYTDTPFRILENHASKVQQTNVRKPLELGVSLSVPEHLGDGKAEGHIFLRNINVIWRMYGGSDWCNPRNISQASGVTCARNAAVCLELALSGIGFNYEVYPDGELTASRLSLTIQDFCLNDKSDDAPWKLVLGYYHSRNHPRNVSSKAVKLNLEAVKPDPSIRIEENRLRIALLPLRLHLHQSQLDFLISFFGGKSSSDDPSPGTLGLISSGEPSEKNDNLQGSAISEEAFLTYFQESSSLIYEWT